MVRRLKTSASNDDVPFLGRHHARFHRPDVVYHIISRTFQGALLLTAGSELNDLIAGVLSRAQEQCPDVRLYGYAFMSNHFHLMLQGPSAQVPAFVGFLKGEISRRWAPRIGWRDGLWGSTYLSTALPSAEDQQRCLEYILSQGVKEGFVRAPECWPGVHVAKQLIGRQKLTGKWLDGTAYAKARFKDLNRKKPQGVNPCDFTASMDVRVDVLPAWSEIDERARCRLLSEMRERIVAAGQRARQGRQPAGANFVTRARRTERRAMPKPPWWEGRRRFICWADPTQPLAREYLNTYWTFQRAFAEASVRYASGDNSAEFPPYAFRPGRAATAALVA
jgi:REP element-mobilizing transposase RayT